MAIREILVAPDPRLKQISVPVAAVDDAVRRLMDDMAETMYAADGIGLSAPQVNVFQRVLVADVTPQGKKRDLLYMANPEIMAASDESKLSEEGCLSVPDQYAEVMRPLEVSVRYLDYHGHQKEIVANGLLAVCVQHEIDHLDGRLFIDHLSRLKRNIILRKLSKAQRVGTAVQ